MNGRRIRMFPGGDGKTLGLMPVPVFEKPGNYRIDVTGENGRHLGAAPLAVTNAHYATQNIVIAKQTAALTPSPGESDTSRKFASLVTEKRYWAEPFQLPLNSCMNSPFGVARMHNGKLTGDYHAGLDQRGALGDPIHAIADGVVRVVQKWAVHGNTVGVDHGQGVASMYLHLSKFAVKEGDEVKKGDVIGYVGATGRATGPHLHWSLYVNGAPVNPLQWVSPKVCGAAK